MNRRDFVIRWCMLVVLIAAFAACAATPTRESTGEYVDDAVVTAKVKSLLAKDELLKALQISVETYRGTVLLSGFVNSPEASAKAVEIANGVAGVRSVKSNLVVK